MKLFVAGVGTHGSALEARVIELGLSDRVSFLGFIPEEELRRYYAAADVALVPSLYEPFGMVALETMAADTPCIVADTGGLKELVVHDATGLRFTPGDATDLAATIDRLFTDTKLHHRLTVDARRMLDEQFNWRSIARRTVDVYDARSSRNARCDASSAPRCARSWPLAPAQARRRRVTEHLRRRPLGACSLALVIPVVITRHR